MTAVLYEKSEKIVSLTLNRPDTRNALSRDVVEGLVNGLKQANADREVSCVIVSGAGKDFSSGGNLRELRALTVVESLDQTDLSHWYQNGIQRIPQTFHEIDVVTIAAVHGHAIGAGCDLAAMCDMRVAASSASFAESFVRVGLISGDGGSWFLPRIIGLARAKEMMLTCRSVSADEAFGWGLVTSVVGEEMLKESAEELADRIVQLPPNALRETNRLLRRTEGLDLRQTLQIAADTQAMLHHQPDHLEAVNAIIDKRPARFTGNLT